MTFKSLQATAVAVKILLLLLLSVSLTAASNPKKVEFDIAGVQLGGGLDETLSILKSASYKTSVKYISFRSEPNRKFALKVIAEKSPQSEAVLSDKIVLHLTYPPSKPLVGSIFREIQFSGDKAPFIKPYFDAAKKKAGGEFYRLHPNAYLGNSYGEQLIKWNSKGKRQGGLSKFLNNASFGKSIDRCIVAYPDMSFIQISNLNSYHPDYLVFNAPPRPFGPKESCGMMYLARFLPTTKGPIGIARMLLIDQNHLAKNNWEFDKLSRAKAKQSLERREKGQIEPDI